MAINGCADVRINGSRFSNFVARPRRISDEWLLDAAGVAVSRFGAGFTLADVAAGAGALGTVAQRFGNERGLLVAMSRAAVDSVRGRMRISPERRLPRRRRHRPPRPDARDRLRPSRCSPAAAGGSYPHGSRRRDRPPGRAGSPSGSVPTRPPSSTLGTPRTPRARRNRARSGPGTGIAVRRAEKEDGRGRGRLPLIRNGGGRSRRGRCCPRRRRSATRPCPASGC